MRKRPFFAVIIGVLAMSIAPAWAAVTASRKLSDGAQFTVDGGTLRIQFWSEDVARITYAAAELPSIKSLSIIGTPAPVRWTWQENSRAFTLAAPHMKMNAPPAERVVSGSPQDGGTCLPHMESTASGSRSPRLLSSDPRRNGRASSSLAAIGGGLPECKLIQFA